MGLRQEEGVTSKYILGEKTNKHDKKNESLSWKRRKITQHVTFGIHLFSFTKYLKIS